MKRRPFPPVPPKWFQTDTWHILAVNSWREFARDQAKSLSSCLAVDIPLGLKISSELPSLSPWTVAQTSLERNIKILCLKYVTLGAHLFKKLIVAIFKISQALSVEFVQAPEGFNIGLYFLTNVLTSALHHGSTKFFIWNEEELFFLVTYYSLSERSQWINQENIWSVLTVMHVLCLFVLWDCHKIILSSSYFAELHMQ